MSLDPSMHHRRSIRLRDYDYAHAGAYFVTICVDKKERVLGEIANNELRLSTMGNIVRECWNNISEHFHHVELDEFVVMPNHLHGIIVIVDGHVGARHASPLQNARARGTGKGSLGAIIGSFKASSSKQAGITLWQRNYYEHIIRNERELESIREYIFNNPFKWADDEYNARA